MEIVIFSKIFLFVASLAADGIPEPIYYWQNVQLNLNVFNTLLSECLTQFFHNHYARQPANVSENDFSIDSTSSLGKTF